MKTLLISMLMTFSGAVVYAQGEIAVKVKDVESNKGKIILALYNSKDGFPSKKEKAFKRVKVDAKKGDISYVFTDIPYDDYALAVMHDENNDDELAKNFFGMPKERTGISNITSFGIPSFSKSMFEVSETNSIVEMEIVFLN